VQLVNEEISICFTSPSLSGIRLAFSVAIGLYLYFFFSFKGLLGLALSSPSPEGASMFLLGSYLKFLHKTPCM